MASTVSKQVMWNRLISVVEEQALALVRTAFSTSVREAGDLSAGVYDAQGRMLAQAVTGTPGHVNAMADAVPHFMRRIGVETMAEGDVYITNDPWEGTGHLHDITVVTPSFKAGVLVGFFACTAHIVDIGGRGFGADANSVYEEGLYIPIMRLMDRGSVDQTLLHIIRGNVREPDQLVGDVYALATCNEIGHRRLTEMMDEFDLADLEEIAAFILDNSRRATLEKINALQPGQAAGEMWIDGYSNPVRLAVSVSIESDRICADFAGTSGLDPKGINVPMVYTKAYACYALKCAIAPEIPNNAASLAPFEVAVIPLGKPGDEASEVAADLYEELVAAGVAAILDDRKERPGVKFNDAELIGYPLQIVVGSRGLAEGVVEFKDRRASTKDSVKKADVVTLATQKVMEARA